MHSLPRLGSLRVKPGRGFQWRTSEVRRCKLECRKIKSGAALAVASLGGLAMNKNSLRAVESDMDALIPLRAAAEMLGLDSSTIRKRAAGTSGLTIVRQGSKLFLVRCEIIAHRRKLIDDARLKNDVMRLVRR